MDSEEILSQMTLKDKIALCSGADFWHTKDLIQFGVSAMMMSDGPHGLRCQKAEADMLGVNKSEPATCFPAAVSTACSWNVKLLEEIGAAIAKEAKTNGIGLVLGPGLNIKRDPLCGRNFEYFSEDPYLSGKLAAAFIRGAQKNGVGTCIKHFALNNQEYKRFNGDSQVDERTMREIYLPAFETAVKEGKPAAVMCAYNKLNGVHCSDNKWLLTDVLRKEWGFDGSVITDWGAMNDRIEGFRAGCDLSMPGGSAYMEADALTAVKSGTLSEADIDVCASRVLTMMLNAQKALAGGGIYNAEEHNELARRAAAESSVLLKNQNEILPLTAEMSVALIGHMAKEPRYQGAGSSHINPTKVTSAMDAMPGVPFAEGCKDDGSTNEVLLAEATKLAQSVQVAVVFAGLTDSFESEGFDRENLKMPEGHVRMIETVAAANPNTVVVLCCGSVVESSWADKVKAILYMGLPGQAGGAAAADLLYGRVNPSGKLAETWPLCYSDCPTYDCYRERKNAQYREGVYVGYRYYDKAGVPVRWPFGFGLSYTTFQYSNLKVEGTTVKATITNNGKKAGAEVVQLYLTPPVGGLHRPVKELKDFAKVFLQPGESKDVTFQLNDRSFAMWADGWQISGGKYIVLVGSGSSESALSGIIEKNEPVLPEPDWQKSSWYEAPYGTPSKEQWESMLGRLMPETPLKKGLFTMDNTVMEMKEHSFVMKCVYKGVEATTAKSFGGRKDYTNPDFRMMMVSNADSPLRSMWVSSGMKKGFFQGMLEMANGHLILGIKAFLKK